MQRQYTDIMSRISDPILWFDECSVPRYDPFTPWMVANLYAEEVALVRIECQACGELFNVAFTNVAASEPLPPDTVLDGKYPMIRDHIRAQTLHFGDPPNTGCCDPGPSMNSMPRQVLEYWVMPFMLGEGLGCHIATKSQNVALDPTATTLRREPEFEIELSLPWMR